MNEYDTELVLKLLRRATKTSDWDLVCEAKEYMEDVCESENGDDDSDN